MVEEARNIETAAVRDRRRPGRVHYGNQHLIAMLRRPMQVDSIELPTPPYVLDDPDDLSSWSDRTLFTILIAATAAAACLWTTVGFAAWHMLFR